MPKNIKISEIQEQQLFSLAQFTYEENFRRHNSHISTNKRISEIISLYMEDLRVFSFSKYYAAYNSKNEIIGSIKVTKWDKLEILPIQSAFNIDLKQVSLGNNYTSFWHVGRFAINGDKMTSIILLKTLIMCAIYPICMDVNSIMIAECDIKLMLTLRSLGIPVKAIGESKTYLFSKTVPIFCYRNDLLSFFQKHNYLYKQESFSFLRKHSSYKNINQPVYNPQYL